MPSNHEVHPPKYTFEGIQDLWLTIRTVIMKGQMGFTYTLLGVIDILLTEVIEHAVVDFDAARAWEESCHRLCFNLAI